MGAWNFKTVFFTNIYSDIDTLSHLKVTKGVGLFTWAPSLIIDQNDHVCVTKNGVVKDFMLI